MGEPISGIISSLASRWAYIRGGGLKPGGFNVGFYCNHLNTTSKFHRQYNSCTLHPECGGSGLERIVVIINRL